MIEIRATRAVDVRRYGPLITRKMPTSIVFGREVPIANETEYDIIDRLCREHKLSTKGALSDMLEVAKRQTSYYKFKTYFGFYRNVYDIYLAPPVAALDEVQQQVEWMFKHKAKLAGKAEWELY